LKHIFRWNKHRLVSNSHYEFYFIPKGCVSGILPRLFAAGTHPTDYGQEPSRRGVFSKLELLID